MGRFARIGNVRVEGRISEQGRGNEILEESIHTDRGNAFTKAADHALSLGAVAHYSSSVATLVFVIIAIVLGLFGVAFTAFGMSNERAYWSQRDPSGDPRKEATPLGKVIKQAWHFATGEYRAPLRIAAIGVLMVWLAVAFAVLAVVFSL